MATQDDLTPFPMLWASYASATPANRESTFKQILDHLKDLPMPSVQVVLSQAPSLIKRVVWQVWAKGADLSGVQLSDVYGLLDTEPLEAIYSIVVEWLGKVDLAHYDLRQVSKASALLRGVADKQVLWTRWLDTATELKAISISELAEHTDGFSPELQLVIWNGFNKNNRLLLYTKDEIEKAGKRVCEYTKRNCPIFCVVVNGSTDPHFEVGQLVALTNGKTGHVVSRLLNGGVWKYNVENVFSYVTEKEIRGTV